MTDPLESIAQEAETGTPLQPVEDGAGMEPEGPTFGQRVGELFLPCPEDPLTKKGFIAQQVNGWLSKRSGVPLAEIQVGENVAHCIDHLFPGGGSQGLPPILNLARSVMAYRDAANKHPDNGPLVRR